MTYKQYNAIRCAYADLQGAYEAYEQGDMHQHDWKAHKLTLDEMLEVFPFIEDRDEPKEDVDALIQELAFLQQFGISVTKREDTNEEVRD